MNHFELTEMLFEKTVTAAVTQLDQGVQVTLFGGELPHIGAVSIVSPAGEITTQQFPGHKEGILSESWAAALSDAGYRPAVVAAGIHYDHLSREGIAAVVDLSAQLLDETLKTLNGIQKEREPNAQGITV